MEIDDTKRFLKDVGSQHTSTIQKQIYGNFQTLESWIFI